MSTATLVIAIQTYWHPGTGRGSGFYLDATTHTGADGLPRLPGRTLKGLLRDAVYRAERWGWPEVSAGTTRALFGSRTTLDDTAASSAGDENLSTPGRLRVADATLPAEVTTYLSVPVHQHLIAGLYREHFSTAINDQGVAVSRSLRGMQVVVPVTLEAEVSELPAIHTATEHEIGNWQDLLAGVFPLINAVGAYRNRGFGRAHLAWKSA